MCLFYVAVLLLLQRIMIGNELVASDFALCNIFVCKKAGQIDSLYERFFRRAGEEDYPKENIDRTVQNDPKEVH